MKLEQKNGEGFILIFDLPRELANERKRVNLELRRMDAEMIQFSIWRSKNLNQLIDVASWIKKSGGKASILEEKLVF